MKLVRIFLVLALLFFSGLVLQAVPEKKEEPQQQLSDFSLVNYGEKGKKLWEIEGKSADILSDIVKLTDVVANVYGEEEKINLKADKGDFDRNQKRAHLENNVVITNTSGAKLTTESLDWDGQAEKVSTSDTVNIERQNMTAVGQGAEGEPNLKKFSLKKEITVQIKPEENPVKEKEALKDRIVITCDGPLEVDYEKNIAVFKNNVSVDDGTMQLYSDVMDVFFLTAKDTKSKTKDSVSTIDKIVARGNVKIVRDENISYSQEATYLAKDKKIILSGRPKLVIYSTEDLNASP